MWVIIVCTCDAADLRTSVWNMSVTFTRVKSGRTGVRQTSAAASAKPALIPELDTYCVCVHVVCVCVHVCVCVCGCVCVCAAHAVLEVQ